MIYIFALIELAVIIILLLHISTQGEIIKRQQKQIKRSVANTSKYDEYLYK
jgi:hypothetical protein